MEVYNGQLVSATMSAPYVNSVLDTYGVTGLLGETDPRQYAGVAPDGRALIPLLYGAVTETKTLVGRGWATPRAFESGAAYLAAIIKTAIADSGRFRDQVHMQAKGITRYVRAVSPNACSRCAILAGIRSAATPFPRHPNCQCIAVPIPEGKQKPKGFIDNPFDYFESLSKADQDKIFTKAGAQAIRDGADIFQVVNARRGARGINYSGAIGNSTKPNSGRRLQPTQIGVKADGSPLLVYTTSEATTRYGTYGKNTRTDASRRSKTLRLMPEQIYLMAGNDPDRALVLLKRYGYIF